MNEIASVTELLANIEPVVRGWIDEQIGANAASNDPGDQFEFEFSNIQDGSIIYFDDASLEWKNTVAIEVNPASDITISNSGETLYIEADVTYINPSALTGAGLIKSVNLGAAGSSQPAQVGDGVIVGFMVADDNADSGYFADIVATVLDPNVSSKDARIAVRVMVANSITEIMRWQELGTTSSQGLGIGSGSGVFADRWIDVDGSLSDPSENFGILSSPSLGVGSQDLTAVYGRADVDAAIAATTLSAFKAKNPTIGGGGSATTGVGVYIEEQTGASNNYSLWYVPGSDKDMNIFSVNVTGTPTAIWDESEDALSWNKILIVEGIGDGGLTNYDLKVGDAVTTPTYGMIQIGNAVIGRTSYKAGSIDLDGTILFRNIGGPVTSEIEVIFTESTGNTCRFALPKSGVGNATYNPRSMLIAGPAPADTDFVKVSYWQTQGIFHNLVCDTSGTGADLGVQNDLEVEGDIFVDSIKESTTAAGTTFANDVILSHAGGIDYNPGSDTDTDLITVGVTGAPRVWWDESQNTINVTHGVDITGHSSFGSAGTPATDRVLYIFENPSATSGEHYGLYTKFLGEPGSASNAIYYSDYIDMSTGGAQNFTHTIYGAYYNTRHSGSGTANKVYGAWIQARKTSTGAVTVIRGLSVLVANTNATGAIGTTYGIEIQTPTATGTITTNYGLYIQNQNTAGTDYAIFTNTGHIRFGDYVTIDQASATGAQPVLLLDQGDVSEQIIKASYSGADVDMIIVELDVTGAPKWGWSETPDVFTLNKGLAVGDGGTTDYANFAGDGELTLFGTAQINKSVDVEPGIVKRSVANPPGEGTEDGFLTHDFDASTDESVFFHWEIPHDYASAGVIHIHFDFFVDTAPAGAESVVWGVEYKKQSVGDNFDFSAGTTTAYTQESITTGTPANDKKIHRSSAISLTVTGFEPGDFVLLRFFRDANGTGGTDDYTADARIVDYHIEYIADKLGETT